VYCPVPPVGVLTKTVPCVVTPVVPLHDIGVESIVKLTGFGSMIVAVIAAADLQFLSSITKTS